MAPRDQREQGREGGGGGVWHCRDTGAATRSLALALDAPFRSRNAPVSTRQVRVARRIDSRGDHAWYAESESAVRNADGR